ncbi:hypothetical protein SLS64_000722 [Diaporthe eres]
MARTVPDCARLLEAIAGSDGWDDRQPAFGLEVGSPKTLFLDAVLDTIQKDSKSSLSGLKVGILREGFEVPHQDANVVASVQAAAQKFSQLGAQVQEVSVPAHHTVSSPPQNLGDGSTKDRPLQGNALTPSIIYNTSPFDSTGHPALSLPCGFVPASDNPEIKLPTGIMLVGRRYDDVTILKAAAAWEKAFDWKIL